MQKHGFYIHLMEVQSSMQWHGGWFTWIHLRNRCICFIVVDSWALRKTFFYHTGFVVWDLTFLFFVLEDEFWGVYLFSGWDLIKWYEGPEAMLFQQGEFLAYAHLPLRPAGTPLGIHYVLGITIAYTEDSGVSLIPSLLQILILSFSCLACHVAPCWLDLPLFTSPLLASTYLLVDMVQHRGMWTPFEGAPAADGFNFIYICAVPLVQELLNLPGSLDESQEPRFILYWGLSW